MGNTTGADLRFERRREEITVTALAAQMGLSRQSVHALENSPEPKPERVKAYRAALFELLRDIKEAS